MFLHIGENNLIPKEEIVAIIDAKTSLKSNDTKSLLKIIDKGDNLGKDNEEIKALIITCQNKVYGSKLSPKTLLKRSFNTKFLTGNGGK